MTVHLVWFRSDLRIHDNTALTEACLNPNAMVLALFISTPEQWRKHSMAPCQAEFLCAYLNDFRCSLANRGIPLLYAQSNDFDSQVLKIKKLCEEHRVTHLFYNYQYELNERLRDKTLEKYLDKKVICHGFDDSLILPPGSVTTKNNKMYNVFTAFKNKWLKILQTKGIPKCTPAPKIRGNISLKKKTLSLSFDYPQYGFINSLFPSSEKEALAKLNNFCATSLLLYKQQRDYPFIDGTSRLSVYLTCGVLSPRQCLEKLLTMHSHMLNKSKSSSCMVWLNELIWREFYRHLIVYYPDLCRNKPFLSWTDKINWCRNDVHLEAWKQGITGYPIIDAAIRQLNSTGWMHNRLRMIVASFLVKDLLIDWRIGENFFMSKLIDGDLAANNGGWQWVASTGVDSVPYFRIFNPIIQSKKFDCNGEFIRKWIPELTIVPNKFIHDPWSWAERSNLALDYPRQIVKHEQARNTTILAYKKASASRYL